MIEPAPSASQRMDELAGINHDLQDRITAAIDVARENQYDGEHHRLWVIDQMVRHLLGCPQELREKMGVSAVYSYEVTGENSLYRALREDEPGWDEGVPP